MSVRNEITVTARRGAIEEAAESAWLVAAAEESEMGSRPMPTIGNALEGAPGVLVQQSTYGQVSPFLRGLTGYHVLNLVDG
ncbi:MAG: Plug domain-containing protein, partial [Acidobacteria bacterium]